MGVSLSRLAEFRDLAHDRVAADAKLLRVLDTPPARDLERGVDQLDFEPLACGGLPSCGHLLIATSLSPHALELLEGCQEAARGQRQELAENSCLPRHHKGAIAGSRPRL